MPPQLHLSPWEQGLSDQIKELKIKSGSHSPSVSMLRQAAPDIIFKIDACFLSNPYATDLFMSNLEREVIARGGLRALLEFYPAQNSTIAEQLGQTLNLRPENLFIANGATEAIQSVVHNFAKKKILVNLPAFSPHYEFAKTGHEMVFYYLDKKNNFELDLEDYLGFVRKEKPDTIILTNPNNPTGNYLRLAQMEYLLEALKEVETVVVDESFIHFAFEDPLYLPVSIAKLTESYPNLVVIKSMSKDFGIAGIRAGYGVMSEGRVKALLANGYLWNSNGFSEYFFRLCTQPKFWEEYEAIRKKHIIETQKFISQLKQIPMLRVYPSFGNFVLVELPDGYTARSVTTVMLGRYGIYVRDCTDKKGLQGEYLRIGSRSKKENDQIIKAFSQIFAPPAAAKPLWEKLFPKVPRRRP
jgi:histidinol-phosphate/aromatic aminotransferase/cobyric acid decarboxylase-like protein